MLNQDQEVFNILLDAVSEAVVIVDEKQRIMEINRVAETMFEYDKNDIKGRSIEVLVPKAYRGSHKAHVDSFIEENRNRKMAKALEVYGLKKGGEIFPVEVELNPFKIYDKTYVMALIKDISKQKETDLDFMLRSTALESASNGVIITNALKPDNPIIYFNKAFAELTGYSEEEILNSNCRFLQGTDRDQKQLDKLRKAIRKGESSQVTLRNYKKDGTLFWNDLYITPIRNDRGIVTNFIGIQNDVTERVRAEEERNHLATIFDESINEIYVYEAESLKFIRVNRGAIENLGYSKEELQNMTPLDLKVNMDEAVFRKRYIAPLLKNKQKRFEFETEHQRKDGTIYPVSVHLQLSSLNERPVFFCIVADITDQRNYTIKLEKTVEERTKQLQEALSKEKELNELKTKFLSLVSHEFKTPLSGISTSVMLLEKYKKTEDQSKRNRHLEIIRDKVHYLNSILNDFLSIERLESGTVTYKYSRFKLSKVINEVVYNANMLLKDGQHINYPDNINDMDLHQDERIIELILTNVVQNAIKYSGRDSKIDIIVSQDEKTTVITVKDYGIGIPDKDLENIFTRYFRAENALNMQGTGIGLNIAKTHIENLGGSIELSSEENVGTTVVLNIPTERYD